MRQRVGKRWLNQQFTCKNKRWTSNRKSVLNFIFHRCDHTGIKSKTDDRKLSVVNGPKYTGLYYVPRKARIFTLYAIKMIFNTSFFFSFGSWWNHRNNRIHRRRRSTIRWRWRRWRNCRLLLLRLLKLLLRNDCEKFGLERVGKLKELLARLELRPRLGDLRKRKEKG